MIDTFGLQPAVDQTGFAMPDGTMLELYDPSAVPSYGYNGDVAIGFRVENIETASREVQDAGLELLGDIVEVAGMNYRYRHFRGPDGRVWGLNQQG